MPSNNEQPPIDINPETDLDAEGHLQREADRHHEETMRDVDHALGLGGRDGLEHMKRKFAKKR